MSISKVIKGISESLFGILLIFISKTTLIDVELGEIHIDTEFPKTEIEITQLRLGPLRDRMERKKLQDNTERWGKQVENIRGNGKIIGTTTRI